MVSYRYKYDNLHEKWQMSDGDVHVWAARLDYQTERLSFFKSLLSYQEKMIIGTIRHPAQKMRFIYCRGILKLILSQYLNVAIPDLEICIGENGKPRLAVGSYPGDFSFNLSHSNDLTLYVVTNKRHAGIDLEYMHLKSDPLKIAKCFFSANEYDLMASTHPSLRQEMFLRIWTLKEAFLKASSRGLQGISGVEVYIATDTADGLTIRNPNWARNLEITQFTPESGYVAALITYD